MGCITSTNKHLYAFKRDDTFNVSVVRVQSDHSMILARQGLLEITAQELVFLSAEQEPVSWALQHLKRYGLTGNIFSFEAGRRSSTGHGIYTFRCSNPDQFYTKFQRSINSLPLVGDRSISSVHSSYIFAQLENHQAHTNHYLEPTSVQVSSSDEPIFLLDSFANDSNDFNINSSDSAQSPSLTAEIIHLPSASASYLNVNPIPHSSSNIYWEQPLRLNYEYNNNISLHDNASCNISQYNSVPEPLIKKSSLDVPPEESAPILNINAMEAERIYENIVANKTKPFSSFHKTCNNSKERFYTNVEFLPTLGDQQQPTSTNTIVNYIILDLHQPQYSKTRLDNEQLLSRSGDHFPSFKKDNSTSTTIALSCGSSTMPKGSTIFNYDNSKLSNNKMESSGSYTRIDFLKTFALMKSSTNYTDTDCENDQEESRITRHSKFVRKAYSISE